MAIKGISVNGTQHRIDYEYLDNLPDIPTRTRIAVKALYPQLWVGNGPYSQGVLLPSATRNSKVDIQADQYALAQMVEDGVTAMWVENDDGVLTVRALGAAPTDNLVLQFAITETEASES